MRTLFAREPGDLASGQGDLPRLDLPTDFNRQQLDQRLPLFFRQVGAQLRLPRRGSGDGWGGEKSSGKLGQRAPH